MRNFKSATIELKDGTEVELTEDQCSNWAWLKSILDRQYTGWRVLWSGKPENRPRHLGGSK